MGDDLDRKMYEAWRSSAHDPNQHPSWGNLSTECRLQWAAAATLARTFMRKQCAAQLEQTAREIMDEIDSGCTELEVARRTAKAGHMMLAAEILT